MYLIDNDGDRWNRSEQNPEAWSMASHGENGDTLTLSTIKRIYGPLVFRSDAGEQITEPIPGVFAVGDKVRSVNYDTVYTIEFGPYMSITGGSTYVVKDMDGLGHPILAEFLKPIPPVDPRVDVAAAALVKSEEGFDWDDLGALDRMDYREHAAAVIAALDEM